MTYRLSSTWFAAVALAFPMAALADISGTQNLSANSTFNLDTGAVVTSGGDMKFSGTSLSFVGTATQFTEGAVGTSAYSGLTQSTVALFPLSLFNNTAISGSSLVQNEVFVVHTNGGNFAKVLLTNVTTSLLTFQYTTFGVSGGGGNTPSITAVQDAGTYTSSIAKGSVFVVKGTNLSAAGFVQTSFPLPASSNGVSITFTPLTGGAGVQAFIVYLYNQGGVNQLAAILPSSLAAGSYNVTVTNGSSTSAPFSAQVVAQKPGLITADSTGNGLVVAQNYISASQLDVNRFSKGTIAGFTVSPARPGQVLIAWMTGLGGVSGGDNTASPGFDFSANGVNIQVLVGGSTIKPAYAGRAPGLAGTDQVNFTLPTNVQTGCTVPFQISENGILSQPTFIAIAPDANSTVCVQPGYTSQQLQNFDNGGTTNVGAFSLTQISESIAGLGNFTSSIAGGGFTQWTGFELAGVPPSYTSLPTGCQVVQLNSSTPSLTGAVGIGVGLDAGAVTLTGPAGSNLTNAALTESSGASYSLTIGGTGSNTSLIGGLYTLNGAGGTAVGAFKATLNLGTPIAVTGGLPSTVNRGSGLTVNWTGGNSSDLVELVGYGVLSSGSGTNTTTSGAEFICFTTAGAKTLNVSSSILNQLPAISAAQTSNGTGTGFLFLYSGGLPTSGSGLFSAPLKAGGSIDNATFTGFVGSGVQAIYQ